LVSRDAENRRDELNGQRTGTERREIIGTYRHGFVLYEPLIRGKPGPAGRIAKKLPPRYKPHSIFGFWSLMREDGNG
jgi:hypothetical protein